MTGECLPSSANLVSVCLLVQQATYAVVHEGFYTAYHRAWHGAHLGRVVHVFKEGEKAVESVQLDEPHHEAKIKQIQCFEIFCYRIEWG